VNDQSQTYLRLIEHATRCWEAEVANAERLSGKHRIMVTATAALIGLGLFKVEWAALRRTRLWFIGGLVLVGAALGLYIWTSDLPQR